jgi:hypothetical protein
MRSRRGRVEGLRASLGEPKQQNAKQQNGHPPLVMVESNVEEWPIFTMGRSKSDSVVAEHSVLGEDGSELKQRLEVSAPGKYRLPGRLDYDVYSAVMELLEIRGGMPEDGTLRFSLHELILILDLEPSGRTYEEVRRSLRRIAATVLESDNAFWSKGQQRHISDTFRLWDVRFDEVADGSGATSRHEIEFGKLFRRSYEEQYLRGLDIDFFWELGSPVAKRLYRLVDFKRDGTASWSTDLFDLQKRIPLGPYGYVSKIKEKLSAAHEELVERGFLAAVRYKGKSGVEYAVSASFVRRRKGLELAGTREDYIAIKLLTESGLRGDVARDLVAKHGPARCTRYANALPSQQNLRSPAGWLRRAIEEGYEIDEAPEQPHLPEASPSPYDLGTLPPRRPRGRPADGPAGGAAGAPEAPEPEAVEETEPVEEAPPRGPDPAAQEAWRALSEELAALRGRDALPPWWADFGGGELDGAALTVLVPNSFAAGHLDEHFGRDLLGLWRRRAGEGASLLAATSLASDRRVPLGEGHA